MMQQYLRIKEQYKDAILFFRLGDFYEMFFDDAILVSRELELTLTGKDCGLSERAPMCGVPFHAVDTYLARLIEKGYKVAICEQMSDPATTKGLVEREVIRVVTPGTVIETSMLEDTRPSYLLCVCARQKRAGVAFADVSTGEFRYFSLNDMRLSLADELARIEPREIIDNDRAALAACVPERAERAGTPDAATFEYPHAAKCLKEHFGKSISDLGLEDERLCVCAAGALLAYLMETQKNALTHILELRPYERSRFMALDRAALQSLELTQTAHGRGKRGSLLSILDRTQTAMGGRLLRELDRTPAQRRGGDRRAPGRRGVLYPPSFRGQRAARGAQRRLRCRTPLEPHRLRRAQCPRLSGAARHTAACAADQKGRRRLRRPLIQRCEAALDPMEDICSLLSRAIDDEAPLSVREGGMIRDGYTGELDELRDISHNGKTYLAEMEQREREATGIKNLKIGYNRVFGYYIEVTRSFYELVPYRYTRKQTLANCERFITEELKELERKILGAEENAVRLEYQLFCEIRETLKKALPRLNATAGALKTLDALLSLARVAQENEYVRPSINDDGRYDIVDGRHPVVEEGLGRALFVPNDTHLDKEHRVMIITGPNMAGKSTYMRQVALITLMAHMGSFVPAASADIALTDRIFTRVGASDDLYGGRSTFMVEMSEMANILKFATERSLLILDEVGRGTSTFDGLSIAWAAVEYIAQKCGSRTLFATHYHELSELEGQLEGVVNYRITAREQGEDVIFLRKIVPGGADRSYGVAVAKLAGLPKGVIARARQIMARLEVDGEVRGSIGKTILEGGKGTQRQLGIADIGPIQLVEEIAKLDVVSMTPIDALNKLFELNEKARRV